MTVNQYREEIEHITGGMKVGEYFNVDAYLFQRAYTCGWPTIYDTPEQAFLSSCIGSAWGAWTVERHPSGNYYTIGKHEAGNKRVYSDPDRAHLYNRMPDGTLELRPEFRDQRGSPIKI